MTIALFANPGQTVTLSVQVLDGYQERTDGYTAPIVESVYLPDGTAMSGISNVAMTQVVTGIFRYNLIIPSGSTSLGTFLVTVSWPNPTDPSLLRSELFLIHVALPFGNNFISPV